MRIKASELPLQPNGAIYHLNLHPEELADTIILVGDPKRVENISSRFDSIEVRHQNRELTAHTGLLKNKPISVISTGMGTDNIDIVLTELDALANIDFKTMEVKPEKRILKMVRIGTCGILQPDIPIESFIASEYSIGLDGLLQFYKHDNVCDEEMALAFTAHTEWHEQLPFPYAVQADQGLLQQIAYDMHLGITASAPGFYGPQGREVRAQLRFPSLKQKIESFCYNEKKMLNLEMESSAIYGLGKLFGHKTLTCCLGIANRVTNEFSADYHKAMDRLIDTVMGRIIEN